MSGPDLRSQVSVNFVRTYRCTFRVGFEKYIHPRNTDTFPVVKAFSLDQYFLNFPFEKNKNEICETLFNIIFGINSPSNSSEKTVFRLHIRVTKR